MKWIKPKDQLPKFGKRVLTAFGDGFKKSIFIQVRQLTRVEQDEKGTRYFWFEEGGGGEVSNTTHWMELPKHPE